MLSRFFARTVVATFVAFLLAPATASAQSSISGLVTDTSSGVLPGVTVEASSPALIEKVRTAVTDGQGRYTIVDLRPGVYQVTFTLPGFTTFVRDGFELPANFTATINAELRVGSLEETITVSGQSPLVDVQSAQRTSSIRRDTLDAIPTGKVWQSAATLIPSVKASQQNVGGARSASQPRLTVHGTTSQNTTFNVDGMKMNGALNGGDGQPLYNEAQAQEVTVVISSPNAEVSAGGLYVNVAPREGGNQFTGATYAAYIDDAWQSDNLSADLKRRGVKQPTATDVLWDVSQSVGGPIKRDKLWFFGTFRSFGNNDIVADSFYPDGRPGMQENRLKNLGLRLTWQVTPRNKLSAYEDKGFKTIDHEYTAGTDVLTAAKRRYPGQMQYNAAAKWTAAATNRLLLETGWTSMHQSYHSLYQPGVGKVRGTPEWYATASRFDFIRQTRTTAGTVESRFYLPRYQISSTASYVTGSHAFKAGAQWHFGGYKRFIDGNADLTQRYRNGVPEQVEVYNTPVYQQERVPANLGVFAQDSWTFERLTLNPGIRFEYFNAYIEAVKVPPGRFVPYREFPERPDLPDWFNVAPRFSAVYDLTGDAKTAIRAGVNKYYLNDWTNFTARYNTMRLQTDTRDWRDLNRDDIAQDNEIGPSNNRNFGRAPDRNPAPGIKRPYFLSYSLGVDREVFPGIAMTASWYRNTYHDLEKADNVLVDVSDYASFRTPNPRTGEAITIYNLNRAKQGLVDILDTTSTDRSRRRETYDGFEVSFNARLAGGGTMFGGWSTERTVRVACDGDDPNTFLHCDESELDIPFRHDFRLAGVYPLPLSLQTGFVLYSFAGRPLTENWAVPANLFPGGRTQAVTVPLIPPGTKFMRQWNQLDVTATRVFQIGKVQFEAALEIFNALNSSVVLNEVQTFGPSLGNPTEILQGRILRVSSQVKF